MTQKQSFKYHALHRSSFAQISPKFINRLPMMHRQATSNVQKRIEFIKAELKRADARVTEVTRLLSACFLLVAFIVFCFFPAFWFHFLLCFPKSNARASRIVLTSSVISSKSISKTRRVFS